MRSSRVLGAGKRLALIAEPETWSQPLAKGLRMHHRSLSLWTSPSSPGPRTLFLEHLSASEGGGPAGDL